MAEPAEHVARAALRLRGFTSRHVDTSAGPVHFVERWGDGSRPPVAVLHGFGSAGVHFGPLLHRLKPHVKRLVAPDMPAHGFSAHPTGGIDPDAILEGLFDALDQVLDEPAVLFGNSMGGYAAVRYAMARPDRVRGLVLASPAGAQASDEALDDLRALFDIGDHQKALEFIDRLLARRAKLRHLWALGVRRKFSQPALIEMLGAVDPARHSLDPVALRELPHPLLVLWGEEERILPDVHLDFWRQSLPEQATLERPAGMGHSPYLDRPRALSRRVLSFIDDLP